MSSELIYGAIATGVALINIPVIAIIITSPALKNCKELLLVGGICAVDTFLALANAVCIVDRLLSFPADSGDKIIQMDCFFRYYVVAFFYANLLVGIMTLLVSIERFIAVFFPLQYLVSYTRNKGVLMMLGLTCLSDLCLLFIPDLIINFNFFELQAYHMLFYHASLFKTVVNLFIYTFRHNELRKQVLAKLLKCC
ncbi:hypothetical protein QR680_015574 [Steinernema hermaphroditum]|uniref:G-protein coupled receptors family 1 profile domain-containing protein n=1 Tax=Steinernema hermaphroditum TaxID=289476 RepID=A0AA39LKH5_9BILA|nr:hypothetical protein QR680_015574 [Steinernema hermaphroditum]